VGGALHRGDLATVRLAIPATWAVSRSTSPMATPVRRRSVWASCRILRPAERPRSRKPRRAATRRALGRRTSPPVVRMACSSRSASVGKSMSASTTVVSILSLRLRSSLSPASLPSSAWLSWPMTSGPARRTSLLKVVGCGTGCPKGMRQNLRQEIESVTSRHRVW
jgi:hypothetical protein